MDKTHQVAPGYSADILIRWGDPVLPDAPAFDPHGQSAEAQRRQFGYNNDFIGYIPLPLSSDSSDHGLLCINHEYTNEEVMFTGAGKDQGRRNQHKAATKEMVDIEMASHGGSIIETEKREGKWRVVLDSRYARRITALDTRMTLSGPAAGEPRPRTFADPTGTQVTGTVNNCAGGITPWGTYLMAAENFLYYFLGDLEHHPRRTPADKDDGASDPDTWEHPEKVNYTRYGLLGGETMPGGDSIGVSTSTPSPTRPTASIYKFVSAERVDPHNRAANRDLLDRGTLFIARFHPDGTLTWLPLTFGTGGLTPDNGFHSQADVLIETRRAANLPRTTPMDRPEDVEPNPHNNRVYMMLTNNSKRTSAQVDAANPRVDNRWGQILELIPPGGDHSAETFDWGLLIQAGNPRDEGVAARWNPATSENGWFSCPDNCAIDHWDRLWIATDQGYNWKRASGTADGLWALETDGAGRGTGRMFFRIPVGAETCGPRFTPDDRTLFVAVQHPATDGTQYFPGFERDSTFEDPATRWPDFDPRMPPRPSVVVIT